jgi:hypothetical protein
VKGRVTTKPAAKPWSLRLQRRDRDLLSIAAAREEVTQSEFLRRAMRDRAALLDRIEPRRHTPPPGWPVDAFERLTDALAAVLVAAWKRRAEADDGDDRDAPVDASGVVR